MIKRILLALELYGKDISIDIIHICDIGDETETGKGKLKLHLAADFLKAHAYFNINQQLLDEDGSNGEIIRDYIGKTGADLVLLGAHSMSAIKRLTFGSTTHDLAVPLFLSH